MRLALGEVGQGRKLGVPVAAAQGREVGRRVRLARDAQAVYVPLRALGQAEALKLGASTSSRS